jgi:hypothetical protein
MRYGVSILKGNVHRMGRAVITAFHAGVKKTLMKVLPDQVGFVVNELKDIDRTTEGTHGRTHTRPLVDLEGCLLPLVFHITLGDIGERVAQFGFLVFMDLSPLFALVLFPSAPIVPIHRPSAPWADVELFKLVEVFQDGCYVGGMAPRQRRDRKGLVRKRVDLLCQHTRR